MIRQTVDLPRGSYDILIESGLLGDPAGLIEPYIEGRGPVAVVTDENVWGLYGMSFAAALRDAGIDACEVVLPPGEKNKSLEGLAFLYGAFAEMKLKRDGLAVALGGGVIGDLCGFAAATYLRGVPYVQIPTTLLAQVDSSVGGKTAINLEQGKNMAGAFYQPRLVAIDPAALKTLPEREFRCGMAEVVKYGAIRSRSLFDSLRGFDPRFAEEADGLAGIIGTCCRIKAGIVARDELDMGERMLLNFGHTFGHALEKTYKYNHGEAVAIGMVLAARLGVEMGLTDPGAPDELAALLSTHGLDTRCPCPPEDLLPVLEADKKSRARDVRMVFLSRIGEAFIRPVSFTELGVAVRKLG